MNQKLLAGSALADGISREYTLNEIAIVTRAGPARLLGLRDKGHLGVGADADVTVYVPDDGDWSRMFARRATSSRAARSSSRKDSCAARRPGAGSTCGPAYDAAVQRDLRTLLRPVSRPCRSTTIPVGALRDAPSRLG